MKLSIIVPTFKERENLPELLKRIFKVFEKEDIKGEVIVVDDNSQDGTEEFVKEYSENKAVRAVVRKNEKGLASACVEGFKAATGDVLLVMDADLQHPPEKIPGLLNAISDGADIAIGSRYAKGGSLGDWGIGRKIVSKGASGLASLFFGKLKNVEDKESGFFAFKRSVIENVDLKPVGYKILLEILVVGSYNRVEEVGFEFGLRKKGDSKLGVSVIFSYIFHLWHLLWISGKAVQIFKFCLVGLVGVGVNLGVLYFLTNLGVFYLYSGVIAIECSLLTNFFINRGWTFKVESKNVSFTKSLVLDHITRSIGMLINFACLFVLTEYFGLFYIFSMLVGIGFATMWNFFGNIKWVWISKGKKL